MVPPFAEFASKESRSGVSPSGSVSLKRTSIVTAVSSGVVAESAFATGGEFGITYTLTGMPPSGPSPISLKLLRTVLNPVTGSILNRNPSPDVKKTP